jgi:hypothetical protein
MLCRPSQEIERFDRSHNCPSDPACGPSDWQKAQIPRLLPSLDQADLDFPILYVTANVMRKPFFEKISRSRKMHKRNSLMEIDSVF